MNTKIITLIALALGCLAVVGIADMSDDSDAAIVDPSTGTQVGDLYYTFSGSNATVVGISSSLSSATSITIPDTVTSGGTTYNVTAIASDVFDSITTLETVTFSANMASIGSGAFRGCTSLALTSLPSSLTSIGKSAFNGCTALALTSLPSGVTTIGTFAFYNCTALALTSLPSGVTSIGNSVFYGCTNLALTSLPSGLTSIGQNAFRNCTNLALTSLPSGVTTIGSGAFYNCTALALTSLPSGVTSIEESAFYGCTNLALTSLPSGLTSIGNSVFYGCTNLALTSLPSGLTSINYNAFNGCTALALTSLPSSLTSIGIGAFQNCTNLESLSIPLATTSIGGGVFRYCTNLTLSLDISVTAGGDTDTVQWATGLDDTGNPTYVVTAPTSYNNRILTNWTYSGTDYNGGDSITMSLANRSITANLDPNTYGTCGDNLNWIIYADYVLTITGTGAMYDYSAGSPAPWNSYATSIVSLSLPEGMTTYGDYAFYGCTGLSGILTIPSAITYVGDSAFYDCGYSAMIIEGSPTLTDATDPTFGSSDGESFKQVLNLGDTVIAAGDYGLPADAVVSDNIPLMGYLGPIAFSETVQKQGAEYDLMLVIPVVVIAALLMAALVLFGLVRKKDF